MQSYSSKSGEGRVKEEGAFSLVRATFVMQTILKNSLTSTIHVSTTSFFIFTLDLKGKHLHCSFHSINVKIGRNLKRFPGFTSPFLGEETNGHSVGPG